jgi:hypothetical protein
MLFTCKIKSAFRSFEIVIREIPVFAKTLPAAIATATVITTTAFTFIFAPFQHLLAHHDEISRALWHTI